jgi:glutathione S-transferase
LRYIANKYGLHESWFPSDVKLRAVCEAALDFHSSHFVPIVGGAIIYPAKKFAPELSPEAKKEVEAKWTTQVWPALEAILKMTEGPLICGSKPCIADLAFFGYLVALYGMCSTSFAASTPGLRTYYEELKKALPNREKYVAEAEKFWK